ncbi:MAG TPA: DNA mismatch repair protein MutS [Bacilli bacterium]|nr:DNA mismatch repair protein MutS [Bacilli bacterium]
MKREDVNIDELSPMMKQYMEIKSRYENELLFFRLGDFYELFFEDGMLASKELELTLTGKNAGLKERIPMCGVPYHSVKPYIEKLISKGYKVAICEQLEDPKTSKGMVKRDVIQVISKGTFVDLDFLNAYDHSYVGSLLDFNHTYVLTYADISTGNLYTLMMPHIKEKLVNEILNLGLKEVILENNEDYELIDTLKNKNNIDINISSEYLEEEYKNLYKNVKEPKLIRGIEHLLYYLVIKELKDLSHFNEAVIINPNLYLELDVHTVRNLELVETIRLKERHNSLIWLTDKTKTAMGSRLLKSWLMNPLKDINELNKRYEKIEILNSEFLVKEELRKDLDKIYDIERLCGKVTCGSLNARDLLQIKNSLLVLPSIKNNLTNIGFKYELETLADLKDLLEKAINIDPPITLHDGGIIKTGFNKTLDELKSIRSGGKKYLAKIEEETKEKTGIKNLRVGYNKVFGYFIEVSKGQVKNVDPSFGWERRQTLTDKERYITPELKEKESLILNAEEKIINLEYELFLEIKDKVKQKIFDLKKIANIISEIDVLCSLSVISEEYSLVKPKLTLKREINIIDGRHPVVEYLSHNEYVANSLNMPENVHTLIITGPNMSGKSTYMRQLALIVIMAQMGSFVPAKEATLPIFDKIYTRIGASDDLVGGESTFMVEMKEAENAIKNATKDSLILFDELGRGTATYDGMSLAEAILEYINNKIKCKTLFSTHYHELTDLEKRFSGIKNVHVSALEENGNIIFLHKVKNGAVDKSYGIHVAKLAKMPDEVIKRASEILATYENSETKKTKRNENQITFDFAEEKPNPVKEQLDTIDPLKITPLEALNILYELKQKNK